MSETKIDKMQTLNTFINGLEKEETVNDDLEKEVKKMQSEFLVEAPHAIGEVTGKSIDYIARYFAKWQKEKDKKWLADNHKQIFNNGYAEGFENGRDDMYDELSKNSVDGIVQDDYQVKLSTGTYIDFDPSLKRKIPFNVEGGDKIIIIVINEK